jgi:predicted O-methyltransferase YrrM
MLAKLQTLCEQQRKLGFWAGLKWYVRRVAGLLGMSSIQIRPKFALSPMVRLENNSSDVEMFYQIFIEEELQGLLQALASSQPRIVIDLGANVGYASLLFLNAFPEAFVLAVEPDPDNAAICRRNLAPYGERAKVIQGAVWPARGKLTLSRGSVR